MTFKLQGQVYVPRDDVWNVFAACDACLKPSALVMRTSPSSAQPLTIAGDVQTSPQVRVLAWYPPPVAIDLPEHAPPAATEAFRQGCKNLNAAMFDAASAMFRRALEVALKDLSPDVEAWKLEKRIDVLAAQHRITPAIRDWAHEIRLDGNEIHSLDTPAPATVEQMRDLAYFVLLYLFTLPKKVDLARARRADGE